MSMPSRSPDAATREIDTDAASGKEPYHALMRPGGARFIEVIDQRELPHAVIRTRVSDAEAATVAIRDMVVRGAPLIGAVGAYGLALALEADPSDDALERAHAKLDAARPTAMNLRWALDRVRARVSSLSIAERARVAWEEADAIRDQDVAINAAIGRHGLELLRAIGREGRVVDVMTHCNAGALATCGLGTATAPIFLAHDEGLPLHVIVSETRPRLQGANLTAWEMASREIPHTLIVDSASGLLMRRGEVDIVIVGADRVAANGDVCNKIGTYDKALAAADNDVPFYVALPSPTIDWNTLSGDAIPIETRGMDEVLTIAGASPRGERVAVAITGRGTQARNFAFDVTPARLVTGYITERGIARSAAELRAMFADHAREST